MTILVIFIILAFIIWGVKEYNKPIFIPLNEDEQKILKLLKDNIDGSTSIANVWIDFEYIFIETNIKGLRFKYYKSFDYENERVSLYLDKNYPVTDKDKIFISSRLENSIIDVMKSYMDRIILEERKKYLERMQKNDEELKEILKNVEN